MTTKNGGKTKARQTKGQAASDGAGHKVPEPPIAQRLRELRQEHRLTMRGLAELAGVSASLISDVERGRGLEPSISAAQAARRGARHHAHLLLLRDRSPSQDRVVRKGDRRALGDPAFASDPWAGGFTSSWRHPRQHRDDRGDLRPLRRGGIDGRSEPVTHEGEEWGMVLAGRLKVWVGDDIYFLDLSDSISFLSTIPHRLANAADEVTEYIWIDTPKTF